MPCVSRLDWYVHADTLCVHINTVWLVKSITNFVTLEQ